MDSGMFDSVVRMFDSVVSRAVWAVAAEVELQAQGATRH
jgi:hypothetical protein